MLKLLLAIVLAINVVASLKFDLKGTVLNDPNAKPECFSQYVAKDTLVAVEVDVSVGYNQKVGISVTDKSPSSNQFYSKPDITEQTKFVFTTHEWSDISFCFTNHLDAGILPNPALVREVSIHVDTGAEAKSYADSKKNEKLNQLEADLRRLEDMADEVYQDIFRAHAEERKLRDMNELANERVQNFSFFSIFTLVAVGIWQIFYLHSYFKSKKLI